MDEKPMTEPAQAPVNIFAADPVLGKYLSHHPSRRAMLLLQGAIFYAIPTGILQLLTLNLDDQTAATFLPFVFALIGVAVGWYILHLWNREVVLYEKGFSYRRGSVTAYFPYEKIVTMRQSIEKQSFLAFSRTVYNYLLISDLDEELAINNLYSNTEKLTRSLDALIARARLPHIRQMIADGQAVPFSDGFRISREGLLHDERELFWHEFSAYRIQNSKLILQSKDNPEWAAIPLKIINNPPLLLALLKERVKNKEAENAQ
jgi:hypothetical protein